MKILFSRMFVVPSVLLVFVLGSVSMSLAGAPVWSVTNPSFNVPWVYAGPSKATAGGSSGMFGQPWMDSLCRSS